MVEPAPVKGEPRYTPSWRDPRTPEQGAAGPPHHEVARQASERGGAPGSGVAGEEPVRAPERTRCPLDHATGRGQGREADPAEVGGAQFGDVQAEVRVVAGPLAGGAVGRPLQREAPVVGRAQLIDHLDDQPVPCGVAAGVSAYSSRTRTVLAGSSPSQWFSMR